jgi:PPP family 3-phenylpropionic acid transporter
LKKNKQDWRLSGYTSAGFVMSAIFSKLPPSNLLFARVYYFAFMGGWGFILPFINLFYVSLGLSGTQIGTIGSVSSLVGLVAAPVLVTEIKKRPQARSFLQVVLVLGAAAYFMIGQQSAFLPIVGIVFLQALATSSVMPVSDSMAVSVSREANSGYGSVRVWASFGWIITVLLSGWLIEKMGFIAGFTGVSLMWLCGAGLVLLIEPRFFASHENGQAPRPSLKTAILRVQKDRTLFGFGLAVVFIGFLNSGVLQFENVFLSELGATKQLISIAGILSAVVELPFMIYADRFARRFGPHRLMLAALVMTAIQRLAVLAFPHIVTIMIVRFIGGVAFSFYTISYMGIISSRTDPSETGTVLALYTITLAGLVNIMAAPLAGVLYDAIGARWLYGFSMTGYALGAFSLWLTRSGKAQAPLSAKM